MSDESSFDKLDFSKYIKDFKDKDQTPFKKMPDYKFNLPGDFTSPNSSALKDITSPQRDAIVKLDVEQLPDFQNLNVLQQFGARLAGITLKLAVNMGHIDATRLRKISDFGAGVGGPTFALAAMAKTIGAEVTAIEENTKAANEIIASNILPTENVHIGNGIEYLNSIRNKVTHTHTETTGYDLITAFMLGPDLSGNLFKKLAAACSGALNENGNLLITSDTGTFSKAQEICQQSGIRFNFIHGVSQGDKIIVPHTLIIPKKSCGMIG